MDRQKTIWQQCIVNSSHVLISYRRCTGHKHILLFDFFASNHELKKKKKTEDAFKAKIHNIVKGKTKEKG